MTSGADGTSRARRFGRATDRPGELGAALAKGDLALNTDGDLLASRQHFERAYQLAERAGDAQAMAVAVLGLAGLWVSERRTVTGAAMLEARLQHVLSLLDQRSVIALRVRARLAAEADYRHGVHAEILALLDEARACGHPIAMAEVLSLAHHCVLGPDDVSLRRELAMELIKVSFRTGRRSDRLVGLAWRTADAYSAGDPHAGRLLSELRDQLSDHDHPAVAFIASAIDVMLAIRAGHLDDAESLAGMCAKSGATAGDIDSEWWSGGQLVTIRWYQGRLTELLPMLRDRVHSMALSAVDNSTLAALAVAAALHGDRRTAASCLAALCGSDMANLPRSSTWLVTMNGVVEAAHLLLDADVAARAYDLLRPHAQLPMVGGPGVTCFGSTHQALGVASLATRNLDGAVDHLRAAVQHNLALGHWPAVVSSRQRLAQAYQSRGKAGDAEAAQRELGTARDEAEAIGLAIAVDRGAVTVGPVTVGPVTVGPVTVGPVTVGAVTVGAGTVGPGTVGAASATCERVGRRWRLTLGNNSVLLEDSIGISHLAVLIANPRRDIRACDLVAGLASLGAAREEITDQAVLDPQAIGAYRSRLRCLDAELDQLPASHGPDQAERLRAEREWLIAQLASAAGLSGRPRTFPDEGERARVAVGKAIRRAIARIAEADDRIAEHLRQTVHTGARCSYWPGLSPPEVSRGDAGPCPAVERDGTEWTATVTYSRLARRPARATAAPPFAATRGIHGTSRLNAYHSRSVPRAWRRDTGGDRRPDCKPVSRRPDRRLHLPGLQPLPDPGSDAGPDRRA